MMKKASGQMKWPTWQKYLVIMSVAAALVVVAGVVLMLRSAEEMDDALDDEAVAQADARPEGKAASPSDEAAVQRDEKASSVSSADAGSVVDAHNATKPATATADETKPRVGAGSPSGAQPAAVDDPSSEKADGSNANRVNGLGGSGSTATPSPATAGAARAAPAPPGNVAAAKTNDWLTLDEHGEPVAAELADGSTIALPTYGDEYEGYDWRPPVLADEAQTVVDYQKLGIGGAGAGMLNVDAEHGKLYWMDGDFAGRISNIRSASLDGEGFRTVQTLHGAGGLKLDAAHQRFYWIANDENHWKVINRASVNGGEPETIVSGVRQPRIAIDSNRSKLFYFDNANVVQCDLDGGNESRLLDAEHLCASAVVDPHDGTVYWACGTRVDGLAPGNKQPRQIVDFGHSLGHINSIAYDDEGGQLYWNNAVYGGIRRANPDGSQIEDIVIGATGISAIAVDSTHRFVYWVQNLAINGSGDVLIRRTPLPPPLVSTKRPAPPLLAALEPPKAAVGSTLRLVGARLADAKSVAFIAYESGTREAAEIISRADKELVIRVPELGPQSSDVCIVVEAPGGVTFTLPRAIKRIELRGAPRAPGFTLFDRYAHGPHAFFVAAGGAFAQVENALIYATAGSNVSFGERGSNTCFLKSGAEFVAKNGVNDWVYQEPFALVYMRDRTDASNRFIPVPAIRPSVIDGVFVYAGLKNE